MVVGRLPVMVPLAMTGATASYESTTHTMLRALSHGQPLLNGYSGFFPGKADAVQESLRKFSDARSRRLLARSSIRDVVVDKRWLGARTGAELAPFQRVFDGGARVVYLVPP